LVYRSLVGHFRECCVFMSSFSMNTRPEAFAPHIYCVIDYVLLQAMRKTACTASIHQRHELTGTAAIAFLPNSVVNWVQILTIGSRKLGEMKVSVCHTRSFIVSQTLCVGALSCWKRNNSPEISSVSGSSCSVSSTSRQYVPFILTPGSTKIRFVSPSLNMAMNIISNSLKVERVRSRSFAR